MHLRLGEHSNPPKVIANALVLWCNMRLGRVQVTGGGVVSCRCPFPRHVDSEGRTLAGKDFSSHKQSIVTRKHSS